jgi:lysozyme
MNLQKLEEEITRDEGVVYEIYKDHLGYPTFGIGHLITDADHEQGQPVGTPVSKERVAEVFEIDCKKHIAECKSLFANLNDYPDDVQRILVNMTFNMGQTRLAKFVNFGKAIRNQDWKTAAVEGRDSRWYNQVTNRAERLMLMLEEV